MEIKVVPLVRFCRETGYPLKQIRNALFDSRRSGIILSGALIRMGGRWYVRPDRFTAYVERKTEEWAARQL